MKCPKCGTAMESHSHHRFSWMKYKVVCPKCGHTERDKGKP